MSIRRLVLTVACFILTGVGIYATISVGSANIIPTVIFLLFGIVFGWPIPGEIREMLRDLDQEVENEVQDFLHSKGE